MGAVVPGKDPMAIGLEQAAAAEIAADGEEAVRLLQGLFRSGKPASCPLLGDPIKKRFHGRVGAAFTKIVSDSLIGSD